MTIGNLKDGRVALLNGANFSGTIKAPEVISPKFSPTDDSLYRFTVQDDFSFNAALRTHIPSLAYVADKGSAFLAFTRTGAGAGETNSGTFEDVDGVVHTVGENVARFGGTNYDPISGDHSQIDSAGNIIPTSPAYEGGGLWAFGDSMTEVNPTFTVHWVASLETMLSQRINAKSAVAGRLLNKNSSIIPGTIDIYDTYLTAIPSMGNNPAFISLQGGINDLYTLGAGQQPEANVLPGMIDHMSKMIDDAVVRAQNVVVWNVHGAADKAAYDAAIEAGRVKYNAWLKNYCAVNGAVYLDMDSVLESPTSPGAISDRILHVGDLHTLSYDGLHPNTLGYRKCAEYIYSKLDRKYLKGYLHEGPTQNLALYSQKFDEVATWAPTTCTAAAEIGIADPANGTDAYSLTATADGGYVVQDLGATVADGCMSIWIKRKTGIGRAFLSYNDNTTVPGSANLAVVPVSDSWQRVYLNGGNISTTSTSSILYEGATSPQFSIVLEKSGDAVYVWGAQWEERQFPTSYVATTSATVTRLQDGLSMSYSAADTFARDTGSVGMTIIPEWDSEEAFNSGSTGEYYLFGDGGNFSPRIYEKDRIIYGLRNSDTSYLTPALIGTTYYGGSPETVVNGQEIGGIMRGQVMPVQFTWSWETGTAMELKAYSTGSTTTKTASTTDRPLGVFSTAYFGRTPASDTKHLYGYIRDVYMSITAEPSSVTTPITDLVNRW